MTTKNPGFVFRAWAKEHLPHVSVRAKTVSFVDLARGVSMVYTIDGATHAEDVIEANAKAKELGLVFSYGIVALPRRPDVAIAE